VVLIEDARSAAIRYFCPTRAGRAISTPNGGGSSVRIATRGSANGESFDVDDDARPIGPCP
jgi:hypothetical protein